MYYYEVCEKYKLEKTKKGDHIILNTVSTYDLSNIADKLKKRIREIDRLINSSLDEVFTGTKGQIKAQELSRKRNLTVLSDEEYHSKLILRSIEDELLKRRRNHSSISTKALNNGGIYTTGIMNQPRVGMGFRGFGGVCL